MNIDQKKDFLLNTAFWSAIFFFAYFGIKFVFQLFWPFLAGLFLAFLLHPAVNWISRFSCAKKSFWSVALLVLLYLLSGILLWLLSCLIVTGIQHLFVFLPKVYKEQIEPFLTILSEQFSGGNMYESSRVRSSNELMSQLQKTLVEYSAKALAFFSSWLGKAPGIFTAFLFAILSSFMISVEYQNISLWIQHNTPRTVHRILLDLKEFIFSTLFQILKAYGILFLITFLELSLGLWLLEVENFLSMAFFIAAADALPIVGPGIVLVPWAVTCCVGGSYFQGIGLLVLYGIISLVRTIIEPKILGKQFGLHPLVTITAMYAGAQIWGIWGFILAPVIVLYGLHLKQKQNWNFSLKNLF